MMGRTKEPVCALVGGPCPRTSDPQAPRFCPLWSDGIVWNNKLTGQETIEHCGARMLVPGMIQTIAASNRPAAAAERAGNNADRLASVIERAVAGHRQSAIHTSPQPIKKIEQE